jgi:glucokinase
VTAPLIGVDLGGTKLLGVAVDPTTSSIVATHRMPTPLGGADIVEAIGVMVAALDSRIASVGIGAAGLVDASGVLRFAPNLPGVVDLDLVSELSSRLGVEVRVDNDATCGALAELLVGAARGVGTTLVVALGTGIGGALIMDGRVRRGAHHMAGEFGHLLVDPRGPECGCGQRGCWEQLASGNALGRLARAAATDGRAPSLIDVVDGRIAELGGIHVTGAVAAGNADATAVLDEFARWVAVGLAGLVNICDPELVVIGGGLAESGDLLLDPVRRHLHTHVVGAGRRPTVRVIPASAGESSAALGAALLAGSIDPWGGETDPGVSPTHE